MISWKPYSRLSICIRIAKPLESTGAHSTDPNLSVLARRRLMRLSHQENARDGADRDEAVEETHSREPRRAVQKTAHERRKSDPNLRGRISDRDERAPRVLWDQLRRQRL